MLNKDLQKLLQTLDPEAEIVRDTEGVGFQPLEKVQCEPAVMLREGITAYRGSYYTVDDRVITLLRNQELAFDMTQRNVIILI